SIGSTKNPADSSCSMARLRWCFRSLKVEETKTLSGMGAPGPEAGGLLSRLPYIVTDLRRPVQSFTKSPWTFVGTTRLNPLLRDPVSRPRGDVQRERREVRRGSRRPQHPSLVPVRLARLVQFESLTSLR